MAAGLPAAQDTVAEICEMLARRRQFLDDRGLAEWPDGTVSGRYGFRHALYQEVLYRRIGSGRRVRLHRLIGAREEAGYGEQAYERAAELAMHFERGRDDRRAVRYLLRAAENAARRSGPREVIRLVTRGLALLTHLPDTPKRRRQELDLLLLLGPAVIVTQGWTSPEIERAYRRAYDLCQQLGETAQLFPVLFGLWLPALVRLEMQTAQGLAEELLILAQRLHDPALRLEAHWALGITVFYGGEFATVRDHMTHGIALYDPRQHQALAALYTGIDVGVNCRLYRAWVLWYLGYPAQALRCSEEALTLAQELEHAFTHAYALHFAARPHQCRQEGSITHAQAEASVTLCREHGFALYVALGTILRGWAVVAQGDSGAGITWMRQGLADYRAMGGVLTQTYWLALLAEAYGRDGQAEAGLTTVAEAPAAVDASGERFYAAELHRLQGELMLQARVQQRRQGKRSRATSPVHDPQLEVEACFHQALTVARRQHARSLELRAALSLARLWQQQGKRAEAHQLLADIYGWFSEGFDTADLQEAQALLKDLS